MIKIFANTKVTVMGLGLHGGGAAVVKWLVKHGAIVTVTDLKNKNQLQSSLDQLKGLKIKYVLGQHDAKDFSQADMIIKNPGVPNDSKYLALSEKALIPTENDASLFFKYCPGTIIGVTGTRGKSTTSSLIYELLKQKQTTWLAGLSGQPMMAILDRIKEGDLVVLELSSWQLEILGQQRISPEIAVLTNIYPDHLNRYKNMASYIKAKSHIFKNQSPADLTVFNFDNPETKKLSQNIPGQIAGFSLKSFDQVNGCFVKNNKIYFRYQGQVKELAKVSDINLLGEHNLYNTLAALCVAGYFKVSQADIKKVLKSFKGLPYRIEKIKQKSGLTYINDTVATTPDATIAALNTFSKPNVVLIAGGSTKNIPQIKFKELAKLINQTCQAVILFDGPGSDNILQELKKIKFKKIISQVKNMAEAISLAESLAKPGDNILLSPACASFNLFVNEFDRGDQFNAIVKSL